MARTPATLNLMEVQQSFRELWTSIDPLLSGNRDLAGQKFMNAGNAVTEREFVTLGQADRRYAPLEKEEVPKAVKDTKYVRIDTFENRGPARTYRYTIFEASDRNYIAWASDGTNWIYAYGVQRGTLASRPAASAMSASDAGYRYFATDREHTWRWSGTGWVLAPDWSWFHRDTFANRPADLVANDAGYHFVATDRNWVWRWSGTAWVFQDHLSTFYREAIGNRPTPGADDVGALFLATNRGWVSRWDGAAWTHLEHWSSAYRDTFANRPSVIVGDIGPLFYATDRGWTWRSDGTNWILQEHLSEAMQDTYANRPTPGSNDVGARFYATDHNVEWRWSGSAWTYEFGMRYGTQANLTTGLGAADAGYLFQVSDFGHVLRWTGSAWGFGPGDGGGGYIQGFAVTPPGPGWVLCNGAATSYLTAAGGTSAFTTPNLTGHYSKFNNGGYTATAAAAGSSADESTHTHNVNFNTGANTNPVVVQSGTGVTIAGDPHTHTLNDLSAGGSAHNHGPGTLDLARTELIPYFRR